MNTPENDFTRSRDPRMRRSARRAGLLAATTGVVLAAVLWLVGDLSHPVQPSTRGKPTTTLAPSAPASARPSPVPPGPVLGSGYSVAEDTAAHQLVVFGGVDSFDVTWLWDGQRWTLARPALSPPGRFAAAAAYDPRARLVMLYGGRLGPGEVVDDTWGWNGTTWRLLDSGAGKPPVGEGSVMAWDSVSNEMILVSGPGNAASQTWAWSGTHRTRRVNGDLPPATFLVGLAVDPVTHTLLGAGCCSVGQGAGSTWRWTGNGWRGVSTHVMPAFTSGLVRDPVRGRLLLLGDPALGAGREMWSWSGRDWSLLPIARLPVFPEGKVTDTADGNIVILGSFAEPVQGAPQPVHLWSWTGSAWHRLA